MHTGLIKKKKRPFLNQRHISSLKNSSERVTERRCVLKIPPQHVWRRAFPPSSYAGARAAPVCEHEAASSSLVLRAVRLRVCGPRLRPRGRGSRAPPRRAHGPRGQHIAGNRRRGWRTRRRFIGRGGPPPRPPRCREPSGNDAGKGPCSCDLVLRASCRDAASDSRGPSGRVVPSALLRGPALVAKRRTCRPLPRPPARVVHASVSRILVDIRVDISAKGFRHLQSCPFYPLIESEFVHKVNGGTRRKKAVREQQRERRGGPRLPPPPSHGRAAGLAWASLGGHARVPRGKAPRNSEDRFYLNSFCSPSRMHLEKFLLLSFLGHKTGAVTWLSV